LKFKFENKTKQKAANIANSQSSNNNEKPLRGLIELTNDKQIFSKLHMWFTWILRTSVYRMSEEFVHGSLCEDLQVKIERYKQQQDLKKYQQILIKNDHQIMNEFKILNLRHLFKVNIHQFYKNDGRLPK
jgi:hypothetical protein